MTEDVGDRKPGVRVLAHPLPPSRDSVYRYINLYAARSDFLIAVQHIDHVLEHHVAVAVHRIL